MGGAENGKGKEARVQPEILLHIGRVFAKGSTLIANSPATAKYRDREDDPSHVLTKETNQKFGNSEIFMQGTTGKSPPGKHATIEKFQETPQ